MLVKELVAELSGLDAEATVIIVDEDTGVPLQIDRACTSEDPPADGSAEVWIVPASA